MTQDWGQKSVRWPSPWPWAMIAALAVGVAAFAGAGVWHYRRAWTPFQQEYLGVYAKSYIPSWTGNARYELQYRVDAKGRKLATDADLGDLVDHKARLEKGSDLYNKAKLRVWMDAAIYGGRSPWQKFSDEWPAAVLAFGLCLVPAIPRDRERWRVRREGLRLRGPEMVTTSVFNKRNGSDGYGIGFVNEIRPWWDRLLFPNKLRHVCIPRERESKHMILMGDSGTGKSALIRQLLLQVAARSETAIVYDPAREYTPTFYRPERGDVILNPLDQRMPYWSPADEVGHEAEALTLATSLFQDDRRENPFFVEGPRKVFAHLLTFKPTPQELAMVYMGAQQQRGGMLASLSMVADSLKLLPRKEEATSTWSAAQWAKDRRGWVFVTSKPEYREPLRPLISLWLDLLVLRLMNDVGGERPATWFVLDELASLQRLPQLLTAVTENRKSGNPVVLGFQGKSQIEARYGREAEALLSQPATKVFLRTSEPESAQWISKAIGDVEMERRRESRSADNFPHTRATHGEQEERRIMPLVIPSQISGLLDRHGYLKSGNLVVPLRFPYFKLAAPQEGFIPRRGTVRPPEPATPVPAAPELVEMVVPEPAMAIEEEPAFFE